MAVSHRPHVFILTPDQQAALDLWEETPMSMADFCRAIGIRHAWLYAAFVKRPSSLSRARGNVRMAGTR